VSKRKATDARKEAFKKFIIDSAIALQEPTPGRKTTLGQKTFQPSQQKKSNAASVTK
jgi:hypothetical protein